jgi:cytochrome c oxidase subunit 2
MTTRRFVLPVLLTVVVALAAAAGNSGSVVTAAPQDPPGNTAIRVVELKATKYEFTPGKVEVPLNTTVQFKVTAADRDHGFEIDAPEMKDKCVKIKKGETATIEYKAAKAGTITFKCCDFCGLGHGRMKGELVVK